MSNFACKHCGRTQVDRDGVGYVAGCSHYPPEGRTKWKTYRVRFSDSDKLTLAVYDGAAWYLSERSRVLRLAVHPVSWEEDEGDE